MLNKIAPEQIGFDFDGVIANIGEAFLRLACKEYNFCSFTLEDITSFKVEACTKIPAPIVDKIFGDIVIDSLTTGLQPMSGALAVLDKITRKTDITIITARSLPAPVTDWFANYLPKRTCNRIRVIAMSDHDRKVEYIQQENLKYFIDDRAETCQQVAQAGLTPILYRQPWNARWNSFSTVTSWQQIATMLCC